MSTKYQKVCTTLNYIEHFLILASKITGFQFLLLLLCLEFLQQITNSVIGLKIYEIAEGIKNYKLIIKKKKKKHDQIVLLAKLKLNKIEVSISKTLIDSVISHDEFVLINNVLQEYNGMKEEMLLYCYK